MTHEQISSITTVTQAITSSDFTKSRNELIKFVKSQLKETDTGTNGDYGVIPYTKGNKKSLLKPGAEKLAKLFGLSIGYEKIDTVEDWEHKFVFYKYKCILTHFTTGKFVGESIRQSNSKEKSFITENVYDCANKVEAKAQKRALVAAVVQATNSSDIFDADVSEFEEEAPSRSVTQEEDPRRNILISRLYGTAIEHGWTDEWIHKAIDKKWKIDSVTKISNQQIEELIEFIVKTYMPVDKDKKPQLRETKVVVDTPPATNPVTTDIQEAQIIIDQKKQEFAKDEKTMQVRRCTAGLSTECLGELPEDSIDDDCKKCRFEAFIEMGKKKKAEEEAQGVLL